MSPPALSLLQMLLLAQLISYSSSIVRSGGRRDGKTDILRGKLHYGRRHFCRVREALSCALCRAHGKQTLCRVPKIQHTANIQAPCAKCLAHGKQMDTRHSPIFAVCRAIKHTVNIYTRQNSLLCRVFLLSTWQI